MTYHFLSTLLVALGLLGCTAAGTEGPEIPDLEEVGKADSGFGFASFTAEDGSRAGSVRLYETAAQDLYRAMIEAQNEMGLALDTTESIVVVMGETVACASNGELFACHILASEAAPNTHSLAFSSEEVLAILEVAASNQPDNPELFLMAGEDHTFANGSTMRQFTVASAAMNCGQSIYGSRCTAFDDSYNVSLKIFGRVPELGTDLDYALSLVDEAGQRTLIGTMDGPDGVVRAGSSEQSLVRGLGDDWRVDRSLVVGAVAAEITIEHVTEGTMMVIDRQDLSGEAGGLSITDFYRGRVDALLGEYGSEPSFDPTTGEFEGTLNETSVAISR